MVLGSPGGPFSESADELFHSWALWEIQGGVQDVVWLFLGNPAVYGYKFIIFFLLYIQL